MHQKHKVDPARLKELVESGESIRQISEHFNVSYSTIRHWIGRLGLRTERMIRAKEFEEAERRGIKRVYARCPRHGHTAFFQRPDGAFRCARCNTAAVAKRRRRVKQILVDEAGGACALCGFVASQGALAFHHLDPATKVFGVSRHGVTRSLDRAREEAKKCVLLCANCHAQVEAGLLEVPVTEDRYSSPERTEGVGTPK